MRVMGAGLSVSVAGTSTTTSVDDGGHFVLQNVPTGDVELHFMGPGVDARLPVTGVTANSTIVISVRVSGSSAEIDDDEREDADHNAEVEGIVTANTGSTLTVAAKTVTIGTTTTIVHGETPMTAKDIHVGDRVHAHGTITTTNTIAASRIEVQQGEETPGRGDDNHAGGEVELQGTISGRAGTCPTISFTVASTKVVTSGSTEFKNASCSGLANGANVEVKGTKQADGSVAASRVELRK